MRATIIVDDNTVYVDGKYRSVDCSPLIADGTHAVQWYEDIGELEFRTVDNVRPPNRQITDFSPYQPYIELWQVENAKQEVIERARQDADELAKKVVAEERERIASEQQARELAEQNDDADARL